MNPFRRHAVLHEETDCITFAGFMAILAPRYGIHWTHFPAGGKRHMATAIRLKKMGLRKGVWDFYFRAAAKPTLWVEFKHGSNKLTSEQEAWRFDLEPMGDLFEVAYGPLAGLAALVKHGLLPSDAYIAAGPSIRIPWHPEGLRRLA